MPTDTYASLDLTNSGKRKGINLYKTVEAHKFGLKSYILKENFQALLWL